MTVGARLPQAQGMLKVVLHQGVGLARPGTAAKHGEHRRQDSGAGKGASGYWERLLRRYGYIRRLFQSTMRSLFRTLGLLVMLSSSFLASAQKDGQKLTKEQLQKMYMDYLDAEGYRPELDSDGDVQFKAEGKTYFINVLEDDPTYFRLVLANIWPIESEEERTQCLVAVDYSNAKSKVAKSYLVKDNIWVGIEVFMPKPEDFEHIFKRSLSALSNGVAHYVTKMREQQGN